MVSNWAESATGPMNVLGSRGEEPRPWDIVSKLSFRMEMSLVAMDSCT